MTIALLAAAACVAVDGDHILARDLAPVSPLFRSLAPDTDLGYSPAPGARRIFHAAELARLAMRHRVGNDPSESGQIREMCVERAMEKLAPERLSAAIQNAIGDAEAKIELVDWSRYPVPPGAIEFPRTGITAFHEGQTPILWRGCVKYGTGRPFAIWARVRISVRLSRVTAREALPAYQPIRRDQLQVEMADAFPFAAQPAAKLEDVAGRVPHRSIPAGSAIFQSFLDAPREIHSGDVVAVEVLSGRARLTFDGRAETAGRRGELIPVRNPETGKTFRARVESAGKVAVAVGNAASAPAKGEK